jgi:flagellar basal body-associated protein FliL
VSWQDELRQLDEELAAGRIGAEQYRARRDQVIAAAANPTGAQPQQQSPAESTTMLPPVGPGSGPQPQLGPNSGPQQQQSMPPQGMPQAPADRTQAITPNWQSGPRPDAERTQLVQGVSGPGYPPGPQSPAQGFQQQQNPWGEQPGDSAPPWVGQDFPPLAANNESWVKQGPEVFSEGRSNTGRIIAIVGVVVVLIGLGVGAFLLFGKGGGGATDNQASATATTAPPTTTTPPSPVRIGNIPGTDTNKTIDSVADLAALNYLTDPELQAYQTATNSTGPARIAVNALDDGDKAVVLNVQATSAAAANTAANTLVQIQEQNHETPLQQPVPGVQLTEVTANGVTVVRAHYVHGKVIVRVEVNGANPTTVLSDMTTVLNAQLAALSANG